jgi:hypothetical protein
MTEFHPTLVGCDTRLWDDGYHRTAQTATHTVYRKDDSVAVVAHQPDKRRGFQIRFM